MIFEVHISSDPSLLRERPGIATGSELRQFLFRWSGFQFAIDEWNRNTPGVFRRSGLGSPTRVYSVIPGLLSDNSLDNVISEDKLSPLPIMPPSIGSHSLGTNLRRPIPQSAATSFATAFTSSVASYHTAGCSRLRSPKSAGTPAMTPWRRFLREQRLLPTPFEEQNWSGRGQHAEFSKAEEHTVPLIPDGRVLGHSASAVVDVVRCRRIALARKTIRCGRRMKREDAIKEVEHLQQLDHAHVVKVIGTCVVENGRDLHILMYPVADRDLDAYMDDDGDGPSSFDRAALERFFVCLASTLAYLHRKLIRHMDIKPKNLLVRHTGNNNTTTTTTTTTTTAYHAGSRAGSSAVPTAARIYLADFGIARSYPSALDAETCSPTAYTRIYAAPEVVAQERRGFKADVFSLGCVFAEMLCALAGGRAARDELRAIREGNDGDDDDDDDDDCDDGDDGDGDVDGKGADRSFQANVAAVTAYVRGLGLPIGEDGGGGAKARWAAAQCVRMLDPDPDGRPDAEELLPSQAGFECCHAGAERLEATVGK